MKLHLRFFSWLAALLLCPASAALASEIPIRIAYPSGMNGLIPVVMERGTIAKAHGLNAEYTLFQYGPRMMEALAAGDVDAVFLGPMPITSFLSRLPAKAKVVAHVGSSRHSVMVPKDSTARTLADLKGKRIAVSFSTDSHLDLLRTLRGLGLEPGKDLTLVNTAPNELVLAFRQSFADAILVRVPQVERVQQEYGARVVHTWPWMFWAIMRDDYLRQHPTARASFLNAVRASVLRTAQNPDQAAQWFGEKLRLDPKIISTALAGDPWFKVNKVDDVQVALSTKHQQYLEDSGPRQAWSSASSRSGWTCRRPSSGRPGADRTMALIDSVESLQGMYDAPTERVMRKQLDSLDDHCIRFIAQSPFLVMATAARSLRADASPRGGKPGSVKCSGSRELLIPDLPGNNRLDSFRNILETGQVGIVFFVPGFGGLLRVNGSAALRTDEELRARCAEQGQLPKLVIAVQVQEAYMHCPKCLMRSGLWAGNGAPAVRPELPTMGQIMFEQTGGIEPLESEEAALARHRARLY